VPSALKWGIIRVPYIQRKHWITIRKVGNIYYNFDSKLKDPEVIGSDVQLKTFLKEEMLCEEKELLIVVAEDTAVDQIWHNSQ